MLNIAGAARFVSDLHLRAERPDLVERFARFLDDCVARRVAALFILGDLFEYWIGDDDLADPFNTQIAALLRRTAEAGVALYFQAGNRDFLIGERFAAAAGVHLLGDTAKVGAGGTALLLQHGDLLCTDDLPYQAFRQTVRAADWQRNFLALPLTQRRADVAALRRRSAEAMREKTAEIMDVNAQAVRNALLQSGCGTLIHGHTHRPGREEIHLDAQGDDVPLTAERWVLSDWDEGRGDALEVDAAGIRRLDFSR